MPIFEDGKHNSAPRTYVLCIMTRNEVVIVLLVAISLILTIAALTRESTFDCRQSWFSDSSSCSVSGGSCISTPVRAGIPGLWNYFAGFTVEQDPPGDYWLKCIPGCRVKIGHGPVHQSNFQFNKLDSVNRVPAKAFQWFFPFIGSEN